MTRPRPQLSQYDWTLDISANDPARAAVYVDELRTLGLRALIRHSDPYV
jgi:hypothetical protein